jgi:outer membrane biosynthesis protein TonB
MSRYRSARCFGAVLLSCVLAACTGDDSQSAGSSAVAPTDAPVRNRFPASEQARAMTGLSHLPVPADNTAFDASLRRHYPPALLEKKLGGSVLVDLSIDEKGFVQNVDVIDGPARTPNIGTVLVDKDPRTGVTVEREVVPTYNPAFGPAARAAMREVRFEPALKDGQPVPFKMRMTIAFDPPVR